MPRALVHYDSEVWAIYRNITAPIEPVRERLQRTAAALAQPFRAVFISIVTVRVEGTNSESRTRVWFGFERQ